MIMTDKEYLDKALAFIVEGIPEENICEELLDIPEEAKICEDNCQNLQKDCVKRFLNYYEEE